MSGVYLITFWLLSLKLGSRISKFGIWSWAKVHLGEESFSLIGFLEWIAST